MKAQAAQSFPAAPEARARAALKRFEEAIQSVLEQPLDAASVAEWTTLRALTSA